MLTRALPLAAVVFLAATPGCGWIKSCMSGDEPTVETTAAPEPEPAADDAVVSGWAVFLAVDRTEDQRFRVPEPMLQDVTGKRNIRYGKVTTDEPYTVSGADGATVATIDVAALATRPAGWIFAMEGKDPQYIEPAPIPRVLGLASEYFGVTIDAPPAEEERPGLARKAGKTKVSPEVLEQFRARKGAKMGEGGPGKSGKIGKMGGGGPGKGLSPSAALYGEGSATDEAGTDEAAAAEGAGEESPE